MFSTRDGDRSLMYELLKIPPFDTSSIIKPFTQLVLEKEILLSLDDTNTIEKYTTYVIADGALDKDIDLYLEIYKVEYRTLYPEGYSKEAGYAQPFLINIGSSDEFKSWFMEEGYGNSRGLFVLSTLNIDTFANNINHFTLGHMQENNKETFFRFYDPKIFPAFLRILTHNQIEQFFQGENVYLCENLVATEELDTYHYNHQTDTLYKSSYNLLVNHLPHLLLNQKPYESMKSIEFYNQEQHRLIFDAQDVTILTQYKLYIHAKKATLSLMNQYIPYKDKTLKSLYQNVFEIAHTGYELGLHDSDTNYLWILANTLHEGIEKLKTHKIYSKIFDISGVVTQSQKSFLLDKLIEEIKEKSTIQKDIKDV